MRRSILAYRAIAFFSLFAVAFVFLSVPAEALSRIERSDGEEPSKTGIIAVPLPPLQPAQGESDSPSVPPGGEEGTEGTEGTDQGETPLAPADEEGPDLDAPPPSPPSDAAPKAPARLQPSTKRAPAVPLKADIGYGTDGLSRPVADLRARLMEIARTGEVERLRPYLETGENGTVLSFGEIAGDPIEFLKSSSGDGEAIEILAIMLEVLEAGYAHVQPGDAEEIYVWPYFTQVAIDELTKPQLVELFELVTAGDYEAMKAFGAYNFYRLGITPDGRLQFFVTGD